MADAKQPMKQETSTANCELLPDRLEADRDVRGRVDDAEGEAAGEDVEEGLAADLEAPAAGEGGASGYIADHNLTRAPRFRGPEDRYSGYRLRPGSPGVRRASDGRNLGIR